jgi:predicted Zn-dependent peptidase
LRGAGASYLTQRLPGLAVVWAAAGSPPLEIADALRATVSDLLMSGPSAEECAAAGKTALRMHAETCDTYTGQAQCIGFYEALGAGRFAFSYEDDILTVTPDEVRALATRYFDPSRALVLLGQPQGDTP